MAMHLDEIQFYLETLNQWMGMHPSASKLLTELSESDIVVEKQCTERAIPDDVVLKFLKTESSSISYRRVSIFGANKLLSKAQNWFVSQVLTTEMLMLLRNTNQPFGYVVRDTMFSRKIIETKFMPENFEKNDSVLYHQAVLYDCEKKPFSFVEESYSSQTLELFIRKYKTENKNKIILT